MINHARTLLINVHGGHGFTGTVGEELVPAEYVPVALPSHITSIRKILFGGTPDKEMLNYRARQYMALLHATELAEFVTDLDSRITYDLADEPYFDDNLFKPSYRQTAGATTQFAILGEILSPDSSGTMRLTWDIEVTGGATVHVQLRSPLRAADEAYTLTSGLSNAIPLVGSTLQFKIGNEVGAKWVVTSLTRPTMELGAIAEKLSTIGEPTMLELFGVGSQQGASEPFKTFRNLWYQHHELPYKLGGLLLAMIYQTDKLR